MQGELVKIRIYFEPLIVEIPDDEVLQADLSLDVDELTTYVEENWDRFVDPTEPVIGRRFAPTHSGYKPSIAFWRNQYHFRKIVSVTPRIARQQRQALNVGMSADEKIR